MHCLAVACTAEVLVQSVISKTEYEFAVHESSAISACRRILQEQYFTTVVLLRSTVVVCTLYVNFLSGVSKNTAVPPPCYHQVQYIVQDEYFRSQNIVD